MIHEDSWFLKITVPTNPAAGTAGPQIRWERRKKPANSPNPPRAGATQTFHKGRGIAFGGVYDVEDSEEGINSEFFDSLYVWNVERNRFFQQSLRRTKMTIPKKHVEARNKKGKSKANEAELLRNLAALEQNLSVQEADDIESKVEMSEDEDEYANQDKPVSDVMPHRRFNAHLAVQGDMLYIYGGVYEQGDRECTFDELHSIDLGKLDGVRELFKRELDDWHEETEMSDSESEEVSSDDESADNDELSGVPLPEIEKPPKSEMGLELHSETQEVEPTEDVVQDDKPHPRPFENLREFFTRTSVEWQHIILTSLSEKQVVVDQSTKEIRTVAFEAAESKWWDCREEITSEEARQEEAGIGEVVSLADRSIEAANAGKRR